jgi:hypothetical protein
VTCTATTITGSCREQDATPLESVLSLPCAGTISNCNGELTCGACQLPAGSYRESCSGCAASSALLTCLSCTNESRVGEESSLSLPCAQGVSNCNGRLVCGSASGC